MVKEKDFGSEGTEVPQSLLGAEGPVGRSELERARRVSVALFAKTCGRTPAPTHPSDFQMEAQAPLHIDASLVSRRIHY